METKNDLSRLGVFSELGYISIGDPYVNNTNRPFNQAAHKAKQMLPGGSKTKSAQQVGYFSENFNRIMQGEGYSDPVKRRRQERVEKGKQNIGKAFMPSQAEKERSGAGNHYGTFGGPVDAFSPLSKNRKHQKAAGKNFLTNPGKKGTGFGYVNVLLGKPQQHAVEPYDRAKEMRKSMHNESKTKMKGGSFKLNLHPKAFFDNNPYRSDRPLPPLRDGHVALRRSKQLRPFQPSSPPKEIGGAKAGCFTAYPSHSADPYAVKKPRGHTRLPGIFRPSQGPKSMPNNSIQTQNIQRKINRTNFRHPTNTLIAQL